MGSEMETTLIEKLALSVIQRIDVLGIKGKARDREAITLAQADGPIGRNLKEYDHGTE
jgi:hypothetical protein